MGGGDSFLIVHTERELKRWTIYKNSLKYRLKVLNLESLLRMQERNVFRLAMECHFTFHFTADSIR